MWYVRDVLYAVLYVRVSCFVVCGCGVSRRYVDVCYCDMFSVVNVYLDHLKFCVVYINSRRYVCCSECNGVSNKKGSYVPSLLKQHHITYPQDNTDSTQSRFKQIYRKR